MRVLVLLGLIAVILLPLALGQDLRAEAPRKAGQPANRPGVDPSFGRHHAIPVRGNGLYRRRRQGQAVLRRVLGRHGSTVTKRAGPGPIHIPAGPGRRRGVHSESPCEDCEQIRAEAGAGRTACRAAPLQGSLRSPKIFPGYPCHRGHRGDRHSRPVSLLRSPDSLGLSDHRESAGASNEAPPRPANMASRSSFAMSFDVLPLNAPGNHLQGGRSPVGCDQATGGHAPALIHAAGTASWRNGALSSDVPK